MKIRKYFRIVLNSISDRSENQRLKKDLTYATEILHMNDRYVELFPSNIVIISMSKLESGNPG